MTALPIRYGAPGCPVVLAAGTAGQPTACRGKPTHAALVGRPPIRVFPCTEHADLPQLRDAHPMTDEDRAELDGRRVQHDRALQGLRFDRVGPVDS